MSERLGFGAVMATAFALACSGCSGGNGPLSGRDAGGSDATGSSSGASSGGGAGSGGSSGSNGSSASSSGSSGGSSGGSASSSGSSSGSGSGGSSGGSSGGTASACSPTVKCTSGQTCCADLDAGAGATVCSSSCSPQDTIGCLAPSDCGGATPDCCETLVFNGGQLPKCTAASQTAQCVAKCTSNITLSCMTTETLHVCTQASDCSGDATNPNCCRIHGTYVCLSNQLKSMGLANCK